MEILTNFNKRKRRGQMKIQQTAFMLIAVTLFFVFVGMFFLTFVFSDIKSSVNLLEEKNALLLVSKLANSPEFSCGNSFSGTKTNCVDFDKVMALENHENDYFGFWGVDRIKILKVYPSGQEEECNSGNYPDCGEIVIEGIDGNAAGIGIDNFVSLCRKENIGGSVEDKCEMGKIIVYYGNGNE